MPEYPYLCKMCQREFDVVKPVAEIDTPERCECGGLDTVRLIALSNLEKSSMQQPYFEPALGCEIKGKGHRERILKERGLEEVGTTSPDTMYKNLEGQREKQKAREWAEL